MKQFILLEKSEKQKKITDLHNSSLCRSVIIFIFAASKRKYPCCTKARPSTAPVRNPSPMICNSRVTARFLALWQSFTTGQGCCTKITEHFIRSRGHLLVATSFCQLGIDSIQFTMLNLVILIIEKKEEKQVQRQQIVVLHNNNC